MTLLRDDLSGRPSGMAVVEMATEPATQAAVTLNGSLFMGMPILVTLKAALLLQSVGLGLPIPGIMGAGPGQAAVPPAAGFPGAAGLNPNAVPFVPGGPGAAGRGRGRGPAATGQGPAAGTRPPWPGPGGRGPAGPMGGRGMGRRANVWVRDAGAGPAAGGAAGPAAAAAGAPAKAEA